MHFLSRNRNLEYSVLLSTSKYLLRVVVAKYRFRFLQKAEPFCICPNGANGSHHGSAGIVCFVPKRTRSAHFAGARRFAAVVGRGPHVPPPCVSRCRMGAFRVEFRSAVLCVRRASQGKKAEPIFVQYYPVLSSYFNFP